MNGWMKNTLAKNPCISTLSCYPSILSPLLATSVVNFLFGSHRLQGRERMRYWPLSWHVLCVMPWPSDHPLTAFTHCQCLSGKPFWCQLWSLIRSVVEGIFYEVQERVKMGPEKQSRQRGGSRSSSACTWTNKVTGSQGCLGLRWRPQAVCLDSQLSHS